MRAIDRADRSQITLQRESSKRLSVMAKVPFYSRNEYQPLTTASTGHNLHTASLRTSF